ncbi:MAG: hypothetical protein K6E29_01750 [Cyanobacteria bacterium RUI128]|nr:hypothetical protein [Cyanobacteria bacterium RUI128]
MQINSYPIQNQPTFTHFSLKKETENYEYYTSTSLFRDDLDWDGLMNLMRKKYKNTDQVNLICHACSDGEEAYSLALKVKKTFGKSAAKFLPVTAKDIDYDNIFRAKRANYVVSDAEVVRLEQHAGLDLNRYFDIYKNDYTYETYAKPRDCLKAVIDFKQGDILDDIKNLPKENTVLMCRNFIPYLPSKSQTELIKQLGERLDSSSLLVLGEFDMRSSVLEDLQKNGFEQTEIKYVFQKQG